MSNILLNKSSVSQYRTGKIVPAHLVYEYISRGLTTFHSRGRSDDTYFS